MGSRCLAAPITAAALWGLAEVRLAQRPALLDRSRCLRSAGRSGPGGLAQSRRCRPGGRLAAAVGWLLWRSCGCWSAGVGLRGSLPTSGLAPGRLLLHGVGAALLRARAGLSAQAETATRSSTALPAPAQVQRLLVLQPAIPTRQKFELAPAAAAAAEAGGSAKLALAAARPGSRSMRCCCPRGPGPGSAPADPAPAEVLSGGFRRRSGSAQQRAALCARRSLGPWQDR